MHAQLLAEFVHGIATTPRPLTREALESHQAHARRLLGESRRDLREHWRAQALTLALGGVLPGIGHLAFGWNAAIIVFVIAVDVAAAWLGDLLKLLFADRTCRRLLLCYCRARDVVSVARAVSRDGIASMYRTAVPSQRPTARAVTTLFFLGLPVASYAALGGILGADLHELGYGARWTRTEVDAAMPAAWLLLVAPVIRIGMALRYSMAEADSLAGRRQLLLASVESLAAFWLAALAVFLVFAAGYGRAISAVMVLSFYLAAALTLGVLAWSRVRRAESDVRRFAATRLEIGDAHR